MISIGTRIAAIGISFVCLTVLTAIAAAQEPPSQAFDGKWRYRTSCAGCHALDGTGFYAFGPALKGNPFVQNAPSSALIQIIQKGRNYRERSHLAYVGMPAYAWIRGGEAEALVQYMKGELQSTAANSPEKSSKQNAENNESREQE